MLIKNSSTQRFEKGKVEPLARVKGRFAYLFIKGVWCIALTYQRKYRTGHCYTGHWDERKWFLYFGTLKQFCIAFKCILKQI